MRQELHLVPYGFPCSLEACEPGFFVFENTLCFKDEYGGFYCENGEAFWGGTTSESDRAKLFVQPVVPEWRIKS